MLVVENTSKNQVLINPSHIMWIKARQETQSIVMEQGTIDVPCHDSQPDDMLEKWERKLSSWFAITGSRR